MLWGENSQFIRRSRQKSSIVHCFMFTLASLLLLSCFMQADCVRLPEHEPILSDSDEIDNDDDPIAVDGREGEDGEGDEEEEPLTEEEAVAINRSRAVLMKVVSLSWPSEGSLGLRFSEQSTAKTFSWPKAEVKAMAMLAAIDEELRDAPSEEILLALGYRHFYGIGTEKACEESLSAYKAVAESVARYMEENDARESRLDPGLMRISLSEVDGVLGEDEEGEGEALEWDVLNANGGDLWSQKEVGWRALVGRGLEENHAEALQHLQRAAAAQDPDAQHNLGYMFMNGLGVKRNYTEARRHFEAAAAANVTAAYNALGYMHYKGTGVPRNLSLGERYLKLAADLDDADAAFNLAALYEEVDRNMTRALPYIQQAADAGFWRGLLAMAEVEERGLRAAIEAGPAGPVMPAPI
mmetsp:Transcript_49319/g.102882  ORF Transcript_49319/g.102882 Transcript_49319/m.102882 type:complete len:411 (-) Transcript_49319:4-1236(-)